MAKNTDNSVSSHSALPPDDQLAERRTIRDYVIILRERFWLAFPLALVVAIGLGYYRAQETPMYQTFATMRFEKPERVVVGPEVSSGAVQSAIDLNTYLQEISSGEMRSRVIESLSPEEISILQRPFLADLEPGQEPPSVGGALGSLSVSDVRNSFIIRIGVAHRDPEAAAIVANRYVDQFMNYLLAGRMGRTGGAADFLQTQAARLEKEAEEAERKLLDYQKRHNLVSLDASTNLINDRLGAADGELTSARLARINIEQLYNQVQDFQARGQDLFEISFIANYGSIAQTRSQLDEYVKTQSILAERYLERHPRMIQIANEIAITREQLAAAVNLAVADLRTNLDTARSREQSMQTEYNNAEAELTRLRDLSGEYNSLITDARAARKNHDQIINRLIEVNTETRLENVPVRPLDRAGVPGGPYTPNIPGIIKTSVMMFFMVFIGIAIGLSFIDDRIKSAWDVENFIGVNLLGIIPDLSSLRDEEKYSLVLENRQVPGTESFLSVYSAVKIHSKLDFPKSVLVTSTIPGEGKTLISCNLSGGFARHGRKTLLIDCDLRRPMLHRHFNKDNDAGLIPWFDNGGLIEGRMENDPHLGILKVSDNLSLLRSGGRSRIPTELLESTEFIHLLEKLQREFELIVIDSPPLGAVTDSLLIAERIDEVIYVCRFNRAYRKHIKQYVQALKNGKNELLGIVLNGLSPRRIEYYSNYRYYRSYKKYYGAES